MVNVIMVQYRSCEAGSSISLVPSRAGFTMKTLFENSWCSEVGSFTKDHDGHKPLLFVRVSLQTLNLAVAIVIIRSPQHGGIQKDMDHLHHRAQSTF